jgi:hypothetical protein
LLVLLFHLDVQSFILMFNYVLPIFILRIVWTMLLLFLGLFVVLEIDQVCKLNSFIEHLAIQLYYRIYLRQAYSFIPNSFYFLMRYKNFEG